MAVARHVQMEVAEGGFVAVQRDVINDPRGGIAAEDKIAVWQHTRFKAIAVADDPPPWLQSATAPLIGPPQRDPPQPVTFQVSAPPRRGPSLPRFKKKQSECCCSLPIVMTINCLCILSIAIGLIVTPTVGGTLACDTLMAIGAIFIAGGVSALVSSICYSICCCCIKSCKDKDDMEAVQYGCGCVAALPLIAFIGLTIGETAAIAGGVTNGTLLHGGGELASCKNTEIPIILNAFSWVLCLMFFGCLCCMLWTILVHEEEEET